MTTARVEIHQRPPKQRHAIHDPEVYQVSENVHIPKRGNPKRPKLERVTCFFPEIIMARFRIMASLSGMTVHECLRLACLEYMGMLDKQSIADQAAWEAKQLAAPANGSPQGSNGSILSEPT